MTSEAHSALVDLRHVVAPAGEQLLVERPAARVVGVDGGGVGGVLPRGCRRAGVGLDGVRGHVGVERVDGCLLLLRCNMILTLNEGQRMVILPHNIGMCTPAVGKESGCRRSRISVFLSVIQYSTCRDFSPSSASWGGSVPAPSSSCCPSSWARCRTTPLKPNSIENFGLKNS